MLFTRPPVLAIGLILAFLAGGCSIDSAETERSRAAAPASPTPTSDATEAVDNQTSDNQTSGQSGESEPGGLTSHSGSDLDPAAAKDPAGLDQEADRDDEPTAEGSAEPAVERAMFDLSGSIGLSTAEINDMVEFVERSTGRNFKSPPRIVAQSKADFEAGLQLDEEEIAELDEAVDTAVRYLQAMGLTSDGVQAVRDGFLALTGSTEAILGYYDPENYTLYVPTDAFELDILRSTLVHELTHALDAQHVDLAAATEAVSDPTEPTETAVAVLSIVEGRAQAVEQRWQVKHHVVPAQLDEDEQLISQVPPAVLLQIGLPYVFGGEFIETQGGPSNTWHYYDEWPATSEEVLFGAVGETEIEVPKPPADGNEIESEEFGSADMLVWLLGESLDPDPQLVFEALQAADGWAGGTDVLWGDETHSCIRVHLAADSDRDLSEIYNVATRWAAGSADRNTTQQDGLVEITSCAPYVP